MPPHPSDAGPRASGPAAPRPGLLVRFGTFFFRHRTPVLPLVLLALFLALRPLFPGGSRRADLLLDAVGLAIAFLGQGLRAAVIGYEYIRRGGRDGKVYADGLVTGGFFAHCRNPLYVGNILILIGLFVVFNNPWAYALGVPFVLLVYVSIVAAEEDYLRARFGRDYEGYCRAVPRWLPDLRGIRRTIRGQAFDWRRLILKEYGSAYAWMMFAILLLSREALAGPGATAGRPALIALATTAVLLTAGWATARLLKKTRALRPARPAPRVPTGPQGSPAPQGDLQRDQPTGAAGPAEQLAGARVLIDALDRDLLDLLGRRADLARRAAAAKIRLGCAIRDPDREAAFLRDRRAWAREAGLDAAAVEEVFRAVLRFSRTVQESPAPAFTEPSHEQI